MANSDRLREALRREAAGMQMPSVMPKRVGRSIRRRRSGALLSILGIGLVAALGTAQLVDNFARDNESDIESGRDVRAGVTQGGIQTTHPRVIGRGRDFGVKWQLVLSRAPGGPCLELQIDGRAKICNELGEGWAPGFEVFPGYASKQEHAYVFGTVPDSDNSGVSISMRGGGQWAGLFFEGPRADDRDYFVRVFPTGEVVGVIQGEGPPLLRFSVSPRRNGAVTKVSRAKKDAFPGFERFSGETTVLYTDPLGDIFTKEPFDVVLRTHDEEICLHIEGSQTCESRLDMGELRVAMAQRVGKGVVIAGLVQPSVDEVTIESNQGDRWPQQLLPVRQAGLEHRYFVLEVQAPFDGRIVVTRDDGSSFEVPLEG
jgi:hypothetical protein